MSPSLPLEAPASRGAASADAADIRDVRRALLPANTISIGHRLGYRTVTGCIPFLSVSGRVRRRADARVSTDGKRNSARSRSANSSVAGTAPVREGLVLQDTRKGVMVMLPSPADYDIRMTVEPLAIDRAAENPTDEQLAMPDRESTG